MARMKKDTAATKEAAQDNSPEEKAKPLVTEKMLYTSTKAIEAAIEKAVKTGNSLQQEYQVIVCSSLVHLAKHHDIRIIRSLLDSFPEGFRKVSMSTFIDKFGQVSFDDDGVIHYNKDRKLDLNGALNTGWWKAAREPIYTPFNLVKELLRMTDRAIKRFDKANPEKGDLIPSELLIRLQSIAKEFDKPNNQTEAKAIPDNAHAERVAA